MRLRNVLVALGLVTIAAGSLSAQKPQTREGFFISFGFGGGSAGFDCDGCGSERESSTSMYLALGGKYTDRVLIGGEISGWSKEQGGATLTIASLMGIAQFYPSATGGFYLKGGAGMTTAQIEFAGDEANESGIGVLGGLGYDFRVGRMFSLSPYAAYTYGITGDAKPNFYQVGLGFTWH